MSTKTFTLTGTVIREVERKSFGSEGNDTIEIAMYVFDLGGAWFKIYEHNTEGIELPDDGEVTIKVEWQADD